MSGSKDIQLPSEQSAASPALSPSSPPSSPSAPPSPCPCAAPPCGPPSIPPLRFRYDDATYQLELLVQPRLDEKLVWFLVDESGTQTFSRLVVPMMIREDPDLLLAGCVSSPMSEAPVSPSSGSSVSASEISAMTRLQIGGSDNHAKLVFAIESTEHRLHDGRHRTKAEVEKAKEMGVTKTTSTDVPHILGCFAGLLSGSHAVVHRRHAAIGQTASLKLVQVYEILPDGARRSIILRNRLPVEWAVAEPTIGLDFRAEIRARVVELLLEFEGTIGVLVYTHQQDLRERVELLVGERLGEEKKGKVRYPLPYFSKKSGLREQIREFLPKASRFGADRVFWRASTPASQAESQAGLEFLSPPANVDPVSRKLSIPPSAVAMLQTPPFLLLLGFDTNVWIEYADWINGSKGYGAHPDVEPGEIFRQCIKRVRDCGIEPIWLDMATVGEELVRMRKAPDDQQENPGMRVARTNTVTPLGIYDAILQVCRQEAVEIRREEGKERLLKTFSYNIGDETLRACQLAYQEVLDSEGPQAANSLRTVRCLIDQVQRDYEQDPKTSRSFDDEKRVADRSRGLEDALKRITGTSTSPARMLLSASLKDLLSRHRLIDDVAGKDDRIQIAFATALEEYAPPDDRVLIAVQLTLDLNSAMVFPYLHPDRMCSPLLSLSQAKVQGGGYDVEPTFNQWGKRMNKNPATAWGGTQLFDLHSADGKQIADIILACAAPLARRLQSAS